MLFVRVLRVRSGRTASRVRIVRTRSEDGHNPIMAEDADHLDEVEPLHALDARMRALWRTERREQEREELLADWQMRDFPDIAKQAMRRGDLVRVSVPGREFQGRIGIAGDDYVGLMVAAREPIVYVRTADVAARRREDPYGGPPVLLEVLERSKSGGTSPRHIPKTFQAVLHEFGVAQQMAAEPTSRVELGTVLPGRAHIIGQLRAHGWDHCYVAANATEIFIPAGVVTYIAWSV